MAEGRYSHPTLAELAAMLGDEQLHDLYTFWDAKVGETAASAGALPNTANRPAGHIVFVTGSKLLYINTSTGWNVVHAAGSRSCRLSMGAKSVPNSADSALGTTSPDRAWTEDADTRGWHNPSSNPTRVTPDIPGMYMINFGIQWAFNGTGGRTVMLYRNGSLITSARHSQPASNDGAGSDAVTFHGYMNGTTDYVEAFVNQSSGGSLNTLAATLTATWIGPA